MVLARRTTQQQQDKNPPPFEIGARAALFCDRCIQVALNLQGDGVRWEIAKQLTRSSGGVGANIEEAHGTTTKSDFAYRMSVALREARESRFWLKRLAVNELLPPERIYGLIQESEEIVAILITIVKKSRGQE